ncbi:non-ribosomal peptide synthetase, partial [Pseudomonas arsenicoxydans]
MQPTQDFTPENQCTPKSSHGTVPYKLPLSSTQEVIWLDQFINPESNDYNLGFLLLIDGELNKKIFSRAFECVVYQHDALRLRLSNTNGQPLQQCINTISISVPIHDFSQCIDVDARVKQHTHSAFTSPFNLNETLWRCELVRVSDTRWYWLFCFHHLISDSLSSSLLIEELADIYSRLIKETTLPALPPSYLEFINEDRIYLDSQRYASDRRFWQERYTHLPPALLQPKNAKKTVSHRKTESVLWQLDKAFFRRIEQFSAAYELSILHFMYAVLSCYFSRTANTTEVVIGIPVHNRRNARQKRTIGMFSSVIPVKVTITPQDSILDVMRKAATELRRCYKHQRLPIAEINRHTQVQQETGRTQLFDITLSLELIELNAHMPGTTVKLSESFRGTPHSLAIAIYQYTFTNLDDDNQPVTIEFNFDTSYLSNADIMALQSRFGVLMEAILMCPDALIGSLPIMSDTEREQLLVDFNATQADFPQEALIHELFEDQARRHPDATALVFESQSLSYGELNRRANRLAHHLIALGVRPDDRVAICVERSLEMVVGLLAILKAGGAYLPLDPAYPAERLAYMLDDAAPVALLTQAALLNTLPGHLPTVLLDAPEPLLPDSNPDARALGLTSHHLAYVIYTSGSTGQPKGVMVEHRNVNRLVINNAYADINSSDCVAHCANIAFDASTWEIWSALLNGGRLHVVPQSVLLDPVQFRDSLVKGQVSALWLTAGLFNEYLDVLEPVIGQLRYLLVGGDVLDPRKILRALLVETPPAHLINGYGPTESTTFATTHTITFPLDIARSIPIGRPIANTQLYILDPQGQPVPIGVTGQIHIAGAGVARGYLNRPALTAERFVTNPFSPDPHARMYCTGDLGRWLNDGSIEYLGRNDFQVKIRGFRIELGEIEAALTQCPGVREAVVLARQDQSGDQRLIAYLLSEPGVELMPAELRQHLAQHLAEYMLPSAFMTLDAFPLTPNGKLDRQALPMPDQSAVVTRGYEPPQGELEIRLADIWQELLGLERVGRHDHFFELGGHSLMIVSLIERLRNLGSPLDVRTVFSTPVLAEMALAISAQGDNLLAMIVPPNRIPDGCQAITPDLLPLISLTQADIDTLLEAVPGGAANVQDIYPLAPLQEGILFHHLLQEQGDAYLLQSLLAFASRQRLDDFLAALQQVIDRHDILRTAACWQGLAQPLQVVWRQAPLPVATFIPSSPDDVAAQLLAHTDPRLHRIELTRAPLFAADIAHDPQQDEWLLAFRFHHLVSDHMTLALIVAEITLILQARTQDLRPALPYRNFIAQTLSVPLSVHEDYFRAQLSDVDAPTAPFGVLHTQGSGEHVSEARLPLDAALAEAVRTQARRLGVSPGVLFHVAWAQVLAHTSGRDDVVFGTVLLGRLQGSLGADQVMGMFINTLPIRVSLAERSVLETVQATYQGLTALLAHEQAPLALAQRCSGVAPPMPLFTALLNYRHSQASEVDHAWEGMRLVSAEERTNYPITLSVDDQGEGFTLTAQTLHGIDPVRLTHYLVTALHGLLDAVVSDPQRPILTVPILPDAERQQLLVDFNATQADFPQEALIHELFEDQAQR